MTAHRQGWACPGRLGARRSRTHGRPPASRPVREETPLCPPPAESELLAKAPDETPSVRGGRPVLPHLLEVLHAAGASRLSLSKQSLFLPTEPGSERTPPRPALAGSHPAGGAWRHEVLVSLPIGSEKRCATQRDCEHQLGAQVFKKGHREPSQRGRMAGLACRAVPGGVTLGSTGRAHGGSKRSWSEGPARSGRWGPCPSLLRVGGGSSESLSKLRPVDNGPL